MITVKEAAARLDGNEYRSEGSRALWAEMKAAGLVAVYGYSDDLMELNGAIDDEFGSVIKITPQGVLENRCDEGDHCPNWHPDPCPKIIAHWDVGDIPWTYETTIPHEKFRIMEDGEVYCEGIVFALKDCVL